LADEGGTKGDVLPVGVLCVWTRGEFCFLVRASKNDVEPRYEGMGIYIMRVSRVQTARFRRTIIPRCLEREWSRKCKVFLLSGKKIDML